MACRLVCVDPARVPEVLPHVEWMIRRAVERSTHTDASAVLDKVRRAAALLWVVRDGETFRAAVVTSISVANGRKRCVIIACGGAGMNEWLPLISQIETYARDEGCKAVIISGRRGWQRALKNYRPRAVVLERKL